MPNKPGPRTVAGKAAVRQNAVTHGLRTADIIMPGEFRLVWLALSYLAALRNARLRAAAVDPSE